METIETGENVVSREAEPYTEAAQEDGTSNEIAMTAFDDEQVVSEDYPVPAEDSELRARLEAEEADPEASRRFMSQAGDFVVIRPELQGTGSEESQSSETNDEPGSESWRRSAPSPARDEDAPSTVAADDPRLELLK